MGCARDGSICEKCYPPTPQDEDRNIYRKMDLTLEAMTPSNWDGKCPHCKADIRHFCGEQRAEPVAWQCTQDESHLFHSGNHYKCFSHSEGLEGLQLKKELPDLRPLFTHAGVVQGGAPHPAPPTPQEKHMHVCAPGPSGAHCLYCKARPPTPQKEKR